MDENQNTGDQTSVASDTSTDAPESQEQQVIPETPEQTESQDNGQTKSTEQGSSESGQDFNESDKGTRRERRQSNYISKLSKQLEESRKQSFQEDIDRGRSPGYKPIQYGEQEYQIDDLQRDRTQYGQSQYQQGLNSAQEVAQTTVWLDSVERDNDYVDQKYPVLDENSDDYDPDAATYVNNLYLQTTGYDGKTVKNPIKYREFVEAYMEGAERIVAQRNAETAQNIARQSGRTSVKSAQGNRRQARDWSKPGAIANLSSDEYEKFKPEIEAWMSQNVNPNIRR